MVSNSKTKETQFAHLIAIEVFDLFEVVEVDLFCIFVIQLK